MAPLDFDRIRGYGIMNQAVAALFVALILSGCILSQRKADEYRVTAKNWEEISRKVFAKADAVIELMPASDMRSSLIVWRVKLSEYVTERNVEQIEIVVNAILKLITKIEKEKTDEASN